MKKKENQDSQPLILVVDDDMMIRLLTREALEQGGLRVEEAENGSSALSRFKDLSPDLVLMDAQMPDMDGFTACALLREQRDGRNVPLIMVTGLEDTASIKRAYEAGATDFVTKPINWPILCHRVQYMLRASQNLKSLRQSEARLSQAQRIAQLGHWKQDLKLMNLEWSTEIYRIFDLETPITYEKFLNAIHFEDQESRQSVLDNALQKENDYFVEYRIVLPNGSKKIVLEQGKAQFDDDGNPIYLVGIIQDISRRRSDEKKIRSLSYYDTLTGLPNRVLF
ncbi:MAG: response regulator, partial [Nitrospiria bacterium]